MDNNLLSARIDDLKCLCEKTAVPKFIGFLTAEEATVAVNGFKNGGKYILFGGYDGAERVMLGVLPDWCEEPVFPIKAISFTYRNCDVLSHRDFLGALMALGIARETVGDILTEPGRTVVFVTSDIAKFVLSQIKKIGSVGVTVNEGFTEPLPNANRKQSFSVTVASTRLDCVVAALCTMSRSVAAEYIADGFVAVNSLSVVKPTVSVKQNDKVTVRKRGKFEITSCDEYSKKGRIILRYDKYV